MNKMEILHNNKKPISEKLIKLLYELQELDKTMYKELTEANLLNEDENYNE